MTAAINDNAGECLRGLPSVFNLSKKSWVACKTDYKAFLPPWAFSPSSFPAWPNAFTQGRLPVGEFDFLAFLPSGEFDIVRHRRPRQQGGRDNSMSSHSIHTQSNSALHDAPRASATVGLFDQAMVTAVVIEIAYIAFIMVGWL
jgi:hypothetical protein